MAKIFLSIGILFIVLGILILFFDKFQLFRLPGDIVIKKENFTLYIPITSSIIISIIITIIFRILK